MREFQASRVPYPRGVQKFELDVVPSGMPLDVEVGCGVGLHPIRYAQSHPDRFLVAIEHTRIKFEKFAGRLAHHENFSNLLAVHADAVEWVTHFLPASSVHRYFFLYPNPWPRPGDEKRRWYAMPFMEKVLETLKPGGTLELATNEAFYAEGARKFFTETWKLKLIQDRKIQASADPDFVPRTHFERKYLARGETCYDLTFAKESDSISFQNR